MKYNFIVSLPLFTIILGFIGVVLCSLLNKRAAKIVTLVIQSCAMIMNIIVGIYMYNKGGYIEYAMGHFNAPIGNEIRISVIEGSLSAIFAFVLICSTLGGDRHLKRDLPETKINYFYVLLNLILVALVALIYTNDVFTGYVFLEISTLASIGITMIRDQGRSIVAAIRYMIFNLLGSGLFLMGLTFLYDWTGYLSMTYIRDVVTQVVSAGNYMPLVIITFTLVSMGLCIKAGLFPFHFWMPDTYGSSTTSARCILSGLISKGYIILLIKMLYRTFGIENVQKTGLTYVFLTLGILAMIVGSYNAIKQKNINKMISFSSAAQIGYIFMGLGLGTTLGLKAAIFHIIVHAITKPLLFISSAKLVDVSDSREFGDLKGAGMRDKIAAAAFTVGSLSMVGFPLTAGFISKANFAIGAFKTGTEVSSDLIVYLALGALIISTVLNAFYFIHTVITIYSKNPHPITKKRSKDVAFTLAAVLLVFGNLFLGVLPVFVSKALEAGITAFI